jgi:uncharacterized protein (TIGR03067 family)
MFGKTFGPPTLLLLLFVSGSGCSNKPDDGLKEFQGTWQLVLQDDRRGKADPEAVKKTTIIVQKDRYKVAQEGKVADEFVIRLDPEKKPAEIDFVILDGPNQGKTEKGIYVLEGNKLKICVADMGKDRPTEFALKDGKPWALLVLQKKE